MSNETQHSGPVNVLNMLRKFERTYMTAGLQEEAADMALAFAAVAELIAASSHGVMDGTGRMYFESGHKVDNFRLALARVGGAK